MVKKFAYYIYRNIAYELHCSLQCSAIVKSKLSWTLMSSLKAKYRDDALRLEAQLFIKQIW